MIMYISVQTDISAGVLEGVVLYCFQRGLAPLLHIIFGSETAKGVLHHQVNSDTLSERYSNAALTVNLVGAVTEGVSEQLRETTNTNAPALHRRYSSIVLYFVIKLMCWPVKTPSVSAVYLWKMP